VVDKLVVYLGIKHKNSDVQHSQRLFITVRTVGRRGKAGVVHGRGGKGGCGCDVFPVHHRYSTIKNSAEQNTRVHSRIVRCNIVQYRACSIITVLYRIAVTHTVSVISLDLTSQNNLLKLFRCTVRALYSLLQAL
jgi:hypothetical protein